MPEVVFYLIQAPTPDGVRHFACRLAETAWLRGRKVFVHTDSGNAARQLDELLWTFRQDSFVPHGLYPGEAGTREPVWVGDGAEPDPAAIKAVAVRPYLPPQSRSASSCRICC